MSFQSCTKSVVRIFGDTLKFVVQIKPEINDDMNTAVNDLF